MAKKNEQGPGTGDQRSGATPETAEAPASAGSERSLEEALARIAELESGLHEQRRAGDALAEQVEREKQAAAAAVDALETARTANDQLNARNEQLRATVEQAQRSGAAPAIAEPGDDAIAGAKQILTDLITGLATDLSGDIKAHAAYLANDAAKYAALRAGGEDPDSEAMQRLASSVKARAETLAYMPAHRANERVRTAFLRLGDLAELVFLGVRVAATV